MMQEPDISLEAGMQPDEMVDELGAILGKYEVPMGLMNKRKLVCSFNLFIAYYLFVGDGVVVVFHPITNFDCFLR